ncbi:MAG TPA: hypothetical protein ENJ40_00565 [Thermosulfurimonas dismutans]|uniref:Uncharacterized protein n=1 Tax=Thermosulfurimonas dismutans TaxID=999894 RepID=A0A7C3GCQ6_9BACT|nr:hypothetical protein [Thermosulfurimonas dismutans]
MLVPLIADKEMRVKDGRKRAAALEELLSEGAPVSEYVPVIVVERGSPDAVAREVDLLKRPPSVEEIWALMGEGKVVPFPGAARALGREDDLVSELLRSRGVGPRILRELLRSTLVVLSPLEEENEEELREATREAIEYLRRSGEEKWIE